MSAGHAVNGVIDKDDSYALGAVSGVNYFCGSDRSEVAVALIGEDDFFRVRSFHSCGDGRSAAVSDFDHIDIEVIVGEDRAAYGSDSDGASFYAEFVDYFCDEPVRYAMPAARTIVSRYIF